MRRNDHDLTDTVRTTEQAQVRAKRLRIYRQLYDDEGAGPLEQAFDEAARL